MHRFFVPSEALFGGVVRIDGESARHISFSLRMKRGESICVCTPDMTEHICSITDFSEGLVTAEVCESRMSRSESPCRIELYQALPKADKLEVIIQKAVECGVHSITPFESSFCISKINDPQKKLLRWNKIALEAAKQSGRGMVPKVNPPISFSEAMKRASQCELGIFCYENERGRRLGELLKEDSSKSISVTVGSEGGFSEAEVRTAEEHGLNITGLGQRILRCETASCFVLSAIALTKELQ